MEKKIKLLPPTQINFIHIQQSAGKRQDGIKIDGGTIPITDLTEEEAYEYGDLIKQEFIKHWRNKTGNV